MFLETIMISVMNLTFLLTAITMLRHKEQETPNHP